MENQEDTVSEKEGLETIYIVEGLADPPEEENLEIFQVETPHVEEEESVAGQEMEPVSVNLGEAAVESEAGAEAEPEAEAVAEGAPRLYVYGSMAAGLLCLLSFGAIYWKKVQKAGEPLVASAPLEQAPAAPGEHLRPADPPVPPGEAQPSQPMEGDPAATAPEPSADLAFLEEFFRAGPRNDAQPPSAEVARAPEPVTAGTEPPPAVPAKAPIRRGEALLQLHNGSLFAGRIMKVSEAGLLLRVPEGEIFFRMEEVAQVLPPEGKASLDNYPAGYVDLANGNRLWGKIVSKGDEGVTIGTAAAKIVLSPVAVQDVRLGPGIVVGP